MKRRYMLFLALWLSVGVANAQQAGVRIVPPQFDPSKIVSISAERVEADQTSARYEGNVVVVQDTSVLNCDLLVIQYRATNPPPAGGDDQAFPDLGNRNYEIERVLAIGRVQMIQGERRATCDQAEYNHHDQTILLTGNPFIAEGANSLQATKIVIYVKTQRVIALGRVKTTIQPQSVPTPTRSSP